jgi:hypothetical protein
VVDVIEDVFEVELTYALNVAFYVVAVLLEYGAQKHRPEPRQRHPRKYVEVRGVGLDKDYFFHKRPLKSFSF